MRWRMRVAAELLRALRPMIRVERSLRDETLPETCRRVGIGYERDSVEPAALGPVVLSKQERAGVRAARMVVARWPAGDTCLRQCLLIGHRLRKHDPVLRIGVRRNARGEFQAHSWLEFGGHAWDPQAAEYAALGSARGSDQ